MFVHGQLTRQAGLEPRSLTFAVIDVETTGLHPGQGSRICEVGIVRMRGDGVVLDEYSTLVDPRLHITNDEYHGISNAEVKGAPTFDRVAGDVLAFLSNAIVVSHNLEYEDKFLTAELGRLGVNLNGVPGLCTLITSRVQLDRYGYKLENVSNLLTGEWPSASHSALGDARTLALTLSKLIAESPQRLSWLGPPPMALPAYPRSGHIAPRAAGLRKGTEGWLATLTARLPQMAYPPAPRPADVANYRAMLGHALADGRVVGEEAASLALLAARAGLTRTTARQLHEEFLADARVRAEADGVVTSTELKELQRAGRELAASHLISDLEEAAAADRAKRNGPLRGWRLLPVGDSPKVTELIDFAVGHGAAVAANVTKTVRLVVADGAVDDDPRLAKARAAGIDVVAPEIARQILEKEITAPSQGLFADPDGRVLSEQLAAERAPETRPGRPEWHEFWRPRELTAAEYQALFVIRRQDWDEVPDQSRPPALAPRPAPAKRGGCAAAAVMVGMVAYGITEAVPWMFG